MPTALTLTFDQTGLTPGVVDRARTDISSLASETGRAFPVTITIDGIPDGATADIELLDEPPSSNPLLTQVSATVWQLEFDAGVWGPFRVRCRAMNSGRVVASVTRRISIRSPHLGIAYPANAERIDPSASSVATVGSVALTEMNEGDTNRPIVDFHRELVEQVEALAVGSVDPTARSAAAAAQSTATAAGSAASAAQSTATAAGTAATTAASAASAAQSTASAAVPKALYDANTVLIATADDTPIALTMPPSTGLFRLASGAIKAATAAEIQALLGVGGSGGSASLAIPPALRGRTAGALDDEFDSTTIGASWVFRDTTTGPTNRTPNFGALTENTDLTGATTVPNVSLHTQGRASWMLVQTTTTGPAIYYIYKPFTWVAGQDYYARAIATHPRGTVSTSMVNLCLWANAGGVPDANNRAFVMYDHVNLTVRWTSISAGISTNVAYNMAEGRGLNPYFLIANPSGVLGGGANWYGEAFVDDGNRQIPSLIGNASFTWTPAFIGFVWAQSPGKPNVLAVDFVRETAGHPLFH